MDNIYLIGMMGSGKSTIAKKLSKKLNMNFVDIDNDIEIINEMEIAEIFTNFGEKKFREMESAYFVEKSKQKNNIFSTGGGIILKKENRDALINNGTTFLLESNNNVLFDRIKDTKNRPLLSEPDNLKTISNIWSKRKKHYYNSCHHRIDSTDLSIDDVVEKIIKILK